MDFPDNCPTMPAWEKKAHKIIAALSRAAWLKANQLPNGRLRKKHVPYTIPEVAEKLVEILGMHDRKEAEERAKSIFMYDHEVNNLSLEE